MIAFRFYTCSTCQKNLFKYSKNHFFRVFRNFCGWKSFCNYRIVLQDAGVQLGWYRCSIRRVTEAQWSVQIESKLRIISKNVRKSWNWVIGVFNLSGSLCTSTVMSAPPTRRQAVAVKGYRKRDRTPSSDSSAESIRGCRDSPSPVRCSIQRAVKSRKLHHFFRRKNLTSSSLRSIYGFLWGAFSSPNWGSGCLLRDCDSPGRFCACSGLFNYWWG